ncbi:MAG: hypothetical protein WC444_01130 [Candidatus Paceibacterota bacterium]
MKLLVLSLRLIMERRDSRMVIIISTLVFLFLLLLTQNGTAAYDALGFTSLSLSARIGLFFSTLFDIKNTFTTGSFILAVLGSFLGGINISLAYTYMRLRGQIILRSGLYSGIGVFMAFLGIGCAACGTALLSILLGFFGLSAMLNLLPYQGQEIGYIGLIFLSIASYSLAQKVSAPNVC